MKSIGGHVVITGAGQGLGKMIGNIFLKEGWRVTAVGQKSLSLNSGRKLYLRGDVRFPKELQRVADLAVRKNGPITVWINNVGSSSWRALAKIDENFWDLMIATNLKSVLFGSQAAAKHLKKGGVILNISSLAGKRGSANNSVYCAAKFGVNGITQALAKELGPRGIRVNAICPVYVNTPGLKLALRDLDSPARGQGIQGYLNKFAKGQSALGRLPKAKEVADLCLYLASPAASAITGQCINVDCGVLPQ